MLNVESTAKEDMELVAIPNWYFYPVLHKNAVLASSTTHEALMNPTTDNISSAILISRSVKQNVPRIIENRDSLKKFMLRCSNSYHYESNLSYKANLSKQCNCWSLRCSWSIACQRCSNYIFITDLTPGFNGLDKENCKTGRETFKLLYLVRLIPDVWRLTQTAPTLRKILLSSTF